MQKTNNVFNGIVGMRCSRNKWSFGLDTTLISKVSYYIHVSNPECENANTWNISGPKFDKGHSASLIIPALGLDEFRQKFCEWSKMLGNDEQLLSLHQSHLLQRQMPSHPEQQKPLHLVLLTKALIMHFCCIECWAWKFRGVGHPSEVRQRSPASLCPMQMLPGSDFQAAFFLV